MKGFWHTHIPSLLTATSIASALVLVSLMVLCKQGERHFNARVRGPRAIWNEHRIWRRGGWARVPSFLLQNANFLLEEAKLAWRMFVASYASTSATSPVSKAAASLLLFGIALSFTSARAAVETLISRI